MEGIIIKEIIEENFPGLRDVGFQAEGSLKGQGIYDRDVLDTRDERLLKALRKGAAGEPPSRDWRAVSLGKKHKSKL